MADNTVNILIVDDDENTRKTFKKILKLKGYNVEESDRAINAISLAKDKFFNIVAVDVRLPDLSGLDVLKAIREINQDIVVIMVTAYASIDSSVEAMNKGAYSYLTKPLNMDAVLSVIEGALEKQRLIIENKRLLSELKQANEKLTEMDKRKSSFVANVSHEFKNPLAVIKESLSVLVDGVVGEISSEQREILLGAKSNIERLIRLVIDSLDVSKIESGKMQMRRENFDIGLLTSEVLSTYELELKKKKMLLSKNISANIGMVWADRDRVSEVIINLLTNAIKYTPEGGTIGVDLQGTDKEIRFEISDTGPGIAKEYFEKIFDKFERITTYRQEGTGLGLAIARDIVQVHKGKIWIESELGKGSNLFLFYQEISAAKGWGT